MQLTDFLLAKKLMTVHYNSADARCQANRRWKGAVIVMHASVLHMLACALHYTCTSIQPTVGLYCVFYKLYGVLNLGRLQEMQAAPVKTRRVNIVWLADLRAAEADLIMMYSVLHSAVPTWSICDELHQRVQTQMSKAPGNLSFRWTFVRSAGTKAQPGVTALYLQPLHTV